MRARIRTAIADLSQLTRSARWCVILVAIAVLGTALILARQVRHGMWIGVDPAEQILIARNLVAGNQFAGWSLHTTIDYSPLYSILLALPGLFGIDALAVAGPLNALLFGLTIYVSTRWLRRRLQSTFLLFWAAGTLLLSLPLVTLSSQVLADPLFILLTMLFLFSFLRFLESGERSSLLHAAVFVSLAFLTRYIGFALLASGSLLILLQRGSKYRERLKNAVLFALIAAFPTGLWLLKNFLAHGQLHAMYSARITLPHNLQSGFQALYVWVTARWLDWETGSPQDALALVVMALLLPALLLLAIGAGAGLAIPFIRQRRRPDNTMLVLALFSLAYLVMIGFGTIVQGGERSTSATLRPCTFRCSSWSCCRLTGFFAM